MHCGRLRTESADRFVTPKMCQSTNLYLYCYTFFIASFEPSQLQLETHWFIIEFRFCNLIREGFAIGHNVKCLHVLKKPQIQFKSTL